ncbi:MAG: 4-(cytidine 5'-diphospho)-2-C-methyl-D-erythritol kinase [Candidatus Aminicenantes bacterium]|nr:4-(cytidine 5'-diphospho)-2-C-methyl-D-erythritol kinase [Candidatus Aminicenantes bacterium]
MRIRSFAKINLGLEIVGKRPDDYHEVRTLYQTISLSDAMDFMPTDEDRIELSGTDPSIPWDKGNLIYRAAELLQQRYSLRGGVSIRVEKNIPAGKGLGGGSANAAMTLFALNSLWEIGCSIAGLQKLGSELGADVPYFLQGGLCLGTGRGDVLQPLRDLPALACLLILPKIFISTAGVYANFCKSLTSKDKDSKIIQFLDSPDLVGLYNELEETIFRSYPQVEDIKDRLRAFEPELSLVSGSGSAVFAIFTDHRQADRARIKLRPEFTVCLTETLSRERYWDQVKTGV